jgi:aspartyl/asparaginyl beta-hydroxylase (cupin superfamily)
MGRGKVEVEFVIPAELFEEMKKYSINWQDLLEVAFTIDSKKHIRFQNQEQNTNLRLIQLICGFKFITN